MSQSIDNSMNRFGHLTLQQKKQMPSALQNKMSSAFESGDFGQMMQAYMMMSMVQGNPMLASMMLSGETPSANSINPDFDKITTRDEIMNDNSAHLDAGNVSDIKTESQDLSRAERKQAENGLFATAPKESIALFAKDDTNHENNLTTQLDKAGYKDIVTDNKVDFDAAKEESKKLEEETKGKINHQGVNNILSGNLEGQEVTGDVAEQLGVDVTGDPSGSAADKRISMGKGEKQMQELEALGIVKDGKLQKIEKDSEAEKYLTNLQGNYEKQELLDKVKGADVYAQTGAKDTDGKAEFSKAKVDGNGNIKEFDKTKVIKSEGTDKTAGQQLQLDGVDEELARKITKVNKDGSVEVDLTQLDGEQYAKLKDKGITYSGTSALNIKGREAGEEVQLNIIGDAKNVNLDKGAFKVKTENDALQIQASANTAIKKVEGENLEHLVVKGGNVETDMSELKNLEALKIENSNLKKGLNISSDSDISANLNNITAENNVKIASCEKDAEVKLKNAKLKNIEVNAQNGNAILEGDSKTKADDVKLTGKKATVTADAMAANKIDVSGVSEEAGVLLGNGTKVKDGIFINSEKKNEVVYENKEDQKNTKIKDTAATTNKDNIVQREMEQGDVFKYIGWSEDKYNTAKANEQNKMYSSMQGGYPTGYPGMPAPRQEKWWERGLKGFATGVNMHNQMMGPQYNQYPWMQNGQFGYYS